MASRRSARHTAITSASAARSPKSATWKLARGPASRSRQTELLVGGTSSRVCASSPADSAYAPKISGPPAPFAGRSSSYSAHRSSSTRACETSPRPRPRARRTRHERPRAPNRAEGPQEVRSGATGRTTSRPRGSLGPAAARVRSGSRPPEACPDMGDRRARNRRGGTRSRPVPDPEQEQEQGSRSRESRLGSSAPPSSHRQAYRRRKAVRRCLQPDGTAREDRAPSLTHARHTGTGGVRPWPATASRRMAARPSPGSRRLGTGSPAHPPEPPSPCSPAADVTGGSPSACRRPLRPRAEGGRGACAPVYEAPAAPHGRLRAKDGPGSPYWGAGRAAARRDFPADTDVSRGARPSRPLMAGPHPGPLPAPPHRSPLPAPPSPSQPPPPPAGNRPGPVVRWGRAGGGFGRHRSGRSRRPREGNCLLKCSRSQVRSRMRAAGHGCPSSRGNVDAFVGCPLHWRRRSDVRGENSPKPQREDRQRDAPTGKVLQDGCEEGLHSGVEPGVLRVVDDVYLLRDAA